MKRLRVCPCNLKVCRLPPDAVYRYIVNAVAFHHGYSLESQHFRYIECNIDIPYIISLSDICFRTVSTICFFQKQASVVISGNSKVM